jgi:hypothetical protein
MWSRATQNLHLFGEEILADADAGIANAVNENVVARVEPPDEKAVAERVPALAGAQRDARRAAADFTQRGRLLVPKGLLGQDRDGARRVSDRLGRLDGLDPVRLVWRSGLGVGIGIDRLGEQRKVLPG